jgi:hypothetical protein
LRQPWNLLSGKPIFDETGLFGLREVEQREQIHITAISPVVAWCHVGVMRIVMNGGNRRLKLKSEGEPELTPFDQNLLISIDLSRLRQIVIELVSRLLTEGLLVRI